MEAFRWPVIPPPDGELSPNQKKKKVPCSATKKGAHLRADDHDSRLWGSEAGNSFRDDSGRPSHSNPKWPNSMLHMEDEDGSGMEARQFLSFPQVSQAYD